MVMKQVVQACRDRSNPVVKFKTPDELQSLIDFRLGTNGVEHSELLKLCSKAIDHSVLTGNVALSCKFIISNFQFVIGELMI